MDRVSTPPARLTVTLPGSAPDSPITTHSLALLGVVALLSLCLPRMLGLPVTLPLTFAVLGFRALTRERRVTTTLTLTDDALEFRDAFSSSRTPLAHVHKVVETATHLRIEMPGGDVAVPLAAIPGGARALLDSLPAHVARVVEAPAPPATRTRKTLALWLLLLAVLAALYALARPR